MIISDYTGDGIGNMMLTLLDFDDEDVQAFTHADSDTDVHLYQRDGRYDMEFGDWGVPAPEGSSPRETAIYFAAWLMGYQAASSNDKAR